MFPQEILALLIVVWAMGSPRVWWGKRDRGIEGVGVRVGGINDYFKLYFRGGKEGAYTMYRVPSGDLSCVANAKRGVVSVWVL